jgi:shikimate kinase
MNVILIGYRGCGKTSVGRKLASSLWKDFVDVDDHTRQRFDNDTIANIWATHGEPAWRAAEVEVTRELCAKDDLVIGLGGGTLMQSEARAAVESADAKRIYLKCAVPELARRIEADEATAGARPSLTQAAGGAAVSASQEIATVLAEREPVYRAVADSEFDVTHCSVDEVVRHLLRSHL